MEADFSQPLCLQLLGFGKRSQYFRLTRRTKANFVFKGEHILIAQSTTNITLHTTYTQLRYISCRIEIYFLCLCLNCLNFCVLPTDMFCSVATFLSHCSIDLFWGLFIHSSKTFVLLFAHSPVTVSKICQNLCESWLSTSITAINSYLVFVGMSLFWVFFLLFDCNIFFAVSKS